MDFTVPPLEFQVVSDHLSNFQLNRSDQFSAYLASWTSVPEGQNGGELTQTASWSVWGDFTDTFVAPTLPDCFTTAFPWVNQGELRLYYVAEYQNTNLPDYDSYFQLKIAQTPLEFNCNFNGLNGSGKEEIRSQKY